MSHPTIHPTSDGHVEIRVDGVQAAVLPDQDAETLGQALADLYGLAGDWIAKHPGRTGDAPTPADLAASVATILDQLDRGGLTLGQVPAALRAALAEVSA